MISSPTPELMNPTLHFKKMPSSLCAHQTLRNALLNEMLRSSKITTDMWCLFRMLSFWGPRPGTGGQFFSVPQTKVTVKNSTSDPFLSLLFFVFVFFLSKTSEEKLDPLVFLTPRRNSIHQPYISMTGFYQALRQCDDFLSLFPATLHIILHPPMLLLTKSKPSLPFMLSESPMAPLLISGFGVQILTRLGQSWFDLPTWTEAFELKNVLDTHLSELLIKLFKLLCHHSLSSTVSLRRVYFPLHYNKYIKVICSYAKFFYCFNPMLDPTL